MVGHLMSAQESNGAEIFSNDQYLYGRFEVVMQSAAGDGVVSSFFLYNLQAGIDCKWPEENTEIDVEMTGNDQQVYFTTHHPDPMQVWNVGEDFFLGFDPHDTLQKYTIEWEPDIIRWFVDDELIYTQSDENVQNLKYPMAIMMNLWASEAESWVGEWDPAVMPVFSRYDNVKYYRYTPGNGDAGSNNNFTYDWQDDFTSIDTVRWSLSEFNQLGNLTTFRSQNAEIENSILKLTLNEPKQAVDLVPVTFSVNMSLYDLLPSDVVYLNGTFNGWCGTCNPMTEENGVWSITIDLPPQKYEYIYTVNGWSVSGNAPLASECDYNPCDAYANYGFHLEEGSEGLVLDVICWTECKDCIGLSNSEIENHKERKLLKIFNIHGQEVGEKSGQVLFYIYDDGSVEKVFGVR